MIDDYHREHKMILSENGSRWIKKRHKINYLCFKMPS